MKKELTKKVIDFFNIEAALNAVSNAPGFKFQVILALNQKVIKETLDVIKEKAKNTPEFEEITKLADEIKKRYAKKDKDGNPIIIADNMNGRLVHKYDISDESLKKFEKELEKFWKEEKNNKIKEDQEKIFKDYEEYVTKEMLTVTLITFPESAIPNEYFSKPENAEQLHYFTNACLDLFEE